MGNCQPYAFRGGTERFFADYRSPGPEWLYVWPRDGWLGSAGVPGAPPPSYCRGSPESYNPDPQWQEWLRRTREFQIPQPLHSLIRAYHAQQGGSGEGST